MSVEVREQIALVRRLVQSRDEFCFHESFGAYGTAPDARTHKYRRMAGVERLLKAVFCRKRFRVARSSGGAGVRAPPGVKGGRANGSRVHTQIGEILAQWVAAGPGASAPQPQASWTQQTVLLVAEIVRRRLRPLFTEYVVADPALGIATALDAVLIDMATGMLYNIEFKTGYDGVFDVDATRTGSMAAPLDMLDASPQSFAWAQCAVGEHLLRIKAPEILVQSEVWLVRRDASTSCVEATMVPEYVRAVAPEVVRILSAGKNAVASAKKRKQ